MIDEYSINDYFPEVVLIEFYKTRNELFYLFRNGPDCYWIDAETLVWSQKLTFSLETIQSRFDYVGYSKNKNDEWKKWRVSMTLCFEDYENCLVLIEPSSLEEVRKIAKSKKWSDSLFTDCEDTFEYQYVCMDRLGITSIVETVKEMKKFAEITYKIHKEDGIE